MNPGRPSTHYTATLHVARDEVEHRGILFPLSKRTVLISNGADLTELSHGSVPHRCAPLLVAIVPDY
jgi:hypothetical protein